MPARAAKTTPAKFGGFDRDALQFLHELTVEMNREWFEANKARYQARWVVPMTALLLDVSSRLAKRYAPIKLQPPKLFRIYRDTRFSKDKSPYKTHVAGAIHLRENCSARWRKLVAADKTGKEIAAIVSKQRKHGYEVGGHDDYKKVPKGFAPDHPRAELLKLRGLTGGFPPIPKGLLHKPAFAEWLVAHATAMAPLVTWLYRNVK
jgi:uncharacterized protein (DUF2461 family)